MAVNPVKNSPKLLFVGMYSGNEIMSITMELYFITKMLYKFVNAD